MKPNPKHFSPHNWNKACLHPSVLRQMLQCFCQCSRQISIKAWWKVLFYLSESKAEKRSWMLYVHFLGQRLTFCLLFRCSPLQNCGMSCSFGLHQKENWKAGPVINGLYWLLFSYWKDKNTKVGMNINMNCLKEQKWLQVYFFMQHMRVGCFLFLM